MVVNWLFYVSTGIRLLSVIRKLSTFQVSFLIICVNLSFDGFVFKAAASSNRQHILTSLGKIEAGLVAIGGADLFSPGNDVELYTDGHWVQQPFFPEYSFRGYSTATYENVLYVFGELNSRILLDSIMN